MTNEKITLDEYREEEYREMQLELAQAEWDAKNDELFFPWMDCVSTCNFSNTLFLNEFSKVV